MHLSSTQVNTLFNPLLLWSHQQFTLTYSMLLVPHCSCSGQFPVPCCDSHPGLPGLCSAWTRSSRLQHDSLCCSHSCCCAHLPWVRACGLVIGLVNIDFIDCKASFILTHLWQGCVSGRSVRSRSLRKYLCSVTALSEPHWCRAHLTSLFPFRVATQQLIEWLSQHLLPQQPTVMGTYSVMSASQWCFQHDLHRAQSMTFPQSMFFFNHTSKLNFSFH